MLRVCLISGLLLSTMQPALPDIVDVTVNGSVSASGYMTVECGVGLLNPPPGCVNAFMGLYLQTVSLNFTGTNSNQTTFSDGTTVTGVYGASLSATAFQTTEVDPVGPGTLEIRQGGLY